MNLIENKVKLIISEQLGIPLEKIKNEHSFIKDLGADSLDAVSLLIVLEEALDIEMEDADANKIKTVQSAIDFAKSILNENTNQSNNDNT